MGISMASDQQAKNEIEPIMVFITAIPVYLEVRIVADGDWDGWVNIGGNVTLVTGSAGTFAYGGYVLFASCSIQNGENQLLWVGIR